MCWEDFMLRRFMIRTTLCLCICTGMLYSQTLQVKAPTLSKEELEDLRKQEHNINQNLHIKRIWF